MEPFLEKMDETLKEIKELREKIEKVTFNESLDQETNQRSKKINQKVINLLIERTKDLLDFEIPETLPTIDSQIKRINKLLRIKKKEEIQKKLVDFGEKVDLIWERERIDILVKTMKGEKVEEHSDVSSE